MKLKKVMALSLAAALTCSLAGCGNETAQTAQSSTTADSKESTETQSGGEDALEEELGYADIVLGETYADLTASIKVMSHRTDLADTKFPEYIAAFNEMYPNITVEYETITDYAEQALLRIEQSDWDIMMIPAVDKKDLGTYFVPYGDLETVSEQVRFANTWVFDDLVYGIPSTGNAQGIVYNKQVFADAGITQLPTTPDEFMAALQAIKESNPDVIPLYTNYAAEWTMGAWDAYIGGSATGSAAFMNQELIHSASPFSDRGDGTGPYAVYKLLYDAVALGYTEEDYTTTDWEGCKGMINNGEIGCMVLGSWAYSQMVEAGPNGDDIGYMSFPITVDGKQYASAGPDYSYGINVQSSDDNKKAAMVYVKWLTNLSNFSYSEGGIPIDVNGAYPDLYSAFDGIEFVADEAALPGEETYLNDLNTQSELMINAGGNRKIMEIVEHAAQGDMSYDEIMESWNQAWSDAQTTLGIEAQ